MRLTNDDAFWANEQWLEQWQKKDPEKTEWTSRSSVSVLPVGAYEGI